VTAHGQQDTKQVEDRVNGILSQMTLDEKLNYISGAIVNFASLKGVFNIKPIPRLGLPEIFGNDGTIGILGQGFPARHALSGRATSGFHLER
jgi:beta-glucosidase